MQRSDFIRGLTKVAMAAIPMTVAMATGLTLGACGEDATPECLSDSACPFAEMCVDGACMARELDDLAQRGVRSGNGSNAQEDAPADAPVVAPDPFVALEDGSLDGVIGGTTAEGAAIVTGGSNVSITQPIPGREGDVNLVVTSIDPAFLDTPQTLTFTPDSLVSGVWVQLCNTTEGTMHYDEPATTATVEVAPSPVDGTVDIDVTARGSTGGLVRAHYRLRRVE